MKKYKSKKAIQSKLAKDLHVLEHEQREKKSTEMLRESLMVNIQKSKGRNAPAGTTPLLQRSIDSSSKTLKVACSMAGARKAMGHQVLDLTSYNSCLSKR